MYVVFSTESDTGMTQYFAGDVSELKSIPAASWEKIDMKIRYYYRPDRETGKLYFWDKGGKQVYVDNIHMEFKQVAEAK